MRTISVTCESVTCSRTGKDCIMYNMPQEKVSIATIN